MGRGTSTDPQDRLANHGVGVHHVHGAGAGSGKYQPGVDGQFLGGFAHDDEWFVSLPFPDAPSTFPLLSLSPPEPRPRLFPLSPIGPLPSLAVLPYSSHHTPQQLLTRATDYNLGNSVFKLAFLCAELPSQLVSKWMGPDRWIPSQMVLWSIVATAQFWLSGRTSFLACRALLGILQGGFIPDVILYLSYFYKHHELSLRLGFFWTAMSIADIASALLAYGLLHMRGVQGHAGWRWLFLIEVSAPDCPLGGRGEDVMLTDRKQGLMTLVIGIFAFVLMPAGPCHTASWFRGKNGWFTEKEEKIMVNRVIREDPSKSDMHNREPITPRLLWQSLKDFDLWYASSSPYSSTWNDTNPPRKNRPIYILGLVFQIPMTPIAQYLTLTLKGLHFDTFQANLLTIPYTVVHMITMLGITYLGEIFNELTFIAASGQIWALPFLIYLNSVDTAGVNRWVIYAVTTLLLGYPNAHPIQVGWNSRNSNTVRSRTVSAACYNMFVQAGGIVSSNIYRKGEFRLFRIEGSGSM